MSLLTVEVELDRGRVIPKKGETLPEHASALLTLLPQSQGSVPRRNPLERDPALPRIVYHEHPATPLTDDDWPEACR